MGFLDDARDAINNGIDVVDKKGYEWGAQSRIRDQEVKRAGVYAKLGERLYAAAQATDEYKDFAPDLFSQVVEIEAQIKTLEEDLAQYKEKKTDAAQARAASKAMRNESAVGASTASAADVPAEAVAEPAQVSADAPEVGFCAQCGATFVGDDKFCSKCGAQRN